MIIGKNYYEESQKLFSTGDSELDDLLEEVYYSGLEDGYDYAQKEFSSKLKLGTRLQNKFLEKKKLSNKEAIEEYTKMRDKAIKEGDEDEAEAWQSYIDGVMLNRGEMTEDEYIKKYPLAAKKKYRDKTFSEDYAQKEFASVRRVTKAGKMLAKEAIKSQESGNLSGVVNATKRAINIKGAIRNPKTPSAMKGYERIINNTANNTVKAFPKEYRSEVKNAITSSDMKKKALEQGIEGNKALAGKTRQQRISMLKRQIG